MVKRLSLILIGMIALSGCSSAGDSKTPDAAVLSFLEVYSSRDIEGFCQFLSRDSRQMILRDSGKESCRESLAGKGLPQEPPQYLRPREIIQEGPDRARVIFDYPLGTIEREMVYENGSWRLVLSPGL